MITRFARSRGPVIPKTFFGMHYINGVGAYGYPANTPYVDLGQGALRGWDILGTWALLEPMSKGLYDSATIARLDDHIGRARDLGLPMHFTLGQTPSWANATVNDNPALGPKPPINNQDFVDYLTWMVTRNLTTWGRAIKSWDVWNEPNLSTYYDGSISRLAELTALAVSTIKGIDPLAKVFTPCPVGFSGQQMLDQMLKTLPAGSVDGCSMHAYPHPDQPESIIALIQAYRSAMTNNGFGGLPLVISEATWNTYYADGVYYDENSPPMADSQAAAYLARLLICSWVAGASAVYFYGLDYAWSKIRLLDISDPSQVLPAGHAYQFLSDLLTGGTLSELRFSGRLYTAEIIDRDGRAGSVMWCQDGITANVDISAYSSGKDVVGNAIVLSPSFALGNSPIFLFS